MERLRYRGALGVLALLGTAPPLVAQKHPVTQPLLTASVAGQTVSVLPITMVIVDRAAADSTLPRERVALLHHADSLIVDALLSRAPEITWVMPADLRRMARRGGGLIPDPDGMGQAVMRNWSLSTVPDPLRSNLRKLLAMAGGRFAFIPASLVLRADTAGTGFEGELMVALADVRTGRVVWRSLAKGSGPTANEVVLRAVETIFPTDGQAG